LQFVQQWNLYLLLNSIYNQEDCLYGSNLRNGVFMDCPKREYFPGFVQEHTNMRNDSKRSWNNPYSKFYTPSLKKHLEHYFEQSNVPQELSYIEITNHEFQIQALNREKNFDNEGEIRAGTEEKSAACLHPKEEAAHDDPEIFPQPSANHLIKLEEIQKDSYKRAKFYVGMKKKFNGSPILCHAIRPMQKLWIEVSLRETQALMEGILFDHKDSFT
ncbi:hypothetical protein DVH24_017869, partial [Malus domestica]